MNTLFVQLAFKFIFAILGIMYADYTCRQQINLRLNSFVALVIQSLSHGAPLSQNLVDHNWCTSSNIQAILSAEHWDLYNLI